MRASRSHLPPARPSGRRVASLLTRLGTVLLLGLAGPGGALAQSRFGTGPGLPNVPMASVQDVWTEFTTSCTALLSDPGTFVKNHPTSGPQPGLGVFRSQDNQVVEMNYLSPKGVYRTDELVGLPGQLHVSCSAYRVPTEKMYMDPKLFAEAVRQTVADFKALAKRRGLEVVGGEIKNLYPDTAPQTLPGLENVMRDDYLVAVQVEMAGKKRAVRVEAGGGGLAIQGHYIITPEEYATAQAAREKAARAAPADTAQTPQKPGSGDALQGMRKAAVICLQHYRDAEGAVPAFRAAGYRLTPGPDAGTWRFSGHGVNGLITPAPELACSIASSTVPLAQAQALGKSLVYEGFPNMVQPGAPEGGNSPCDGYSIFAPRRMLWLHFAQAGNSGQCTDDGTSAIIID